MHFLYQVLPLKTNLKLHVIRKTLSTDRHGETLGPSRLRWPQRICLLLHPVCECGVRGVGCVSGTRTHTPCHTARRAPGISGAAADLSHVAGWESPTRLQPRGLHSLRSGCPPSFLPRYTGSTPPSSMCPDFWSFSGNQTRKATFTSTCARPAAHGGRHTHGVS